MATPLHEALCDLGLGRKPLRKLAAVSDCETVEQLQTLSQQQLHASLSSCGLIDHLELITLRLASVDTCSSAPPEQCEQDDASERLFTHSALSPFLVYGLPDEVLVKVCAQVPWRSLCVLSSSCQQTSSAFGSDCIWQRHWPINQQHWPQQPESLVKQQFLSIFRTACVECLQPTSYVFTLLGCRLCVGCERAHPKYNLVSSVVAHEQYGMSGKFIKSFGLDSLPAPRGYGGRLYLRSQVESLKDEPSYSDPKAVQKTHKKHKSHGAHVQKSLKKHTHHDPCCFEVSGLELVDDHRR